MRVRCLERADFLCVMDAIVDEGSRSITNEIFRKTTNNAGETAGYRIRTDWEGCCRPKGLRVECRKVEVFRISLTTRFGCTSGDFVRLALSESRDSRSPHLRLCHQYDNDKVISFIINPIRMLPCLLFSRTIC